MVVGFELRNNFPYWNFSRFKMEFELKIQERQKLLKPCRIKFKYLEVLEEYETCWPKTFSLHLVAFQNISRVCCYERF
jgi:hypothetical protein